MVVPTALSLTANFITCRRNKLNPWDTSEIAIDGAKHKTELLLNYNHTDFLSNFLSDGLGGHQKLKSLVNPEWVNIAHYVSTGTNIEVLNNHLAGDHVLMSLHKQMELYETYVMYDLFAVNAHDEYMLHNHRHAAHQMVYALWLFDTLDMERSAHAVLDTAHHHFHE